MTGIPSTEHIWLQLKTESGNMYYITSKTNDRSLYFIYKIENDKATKLGKGKDPLALEDKYAV